MLRHIGVHPRMCQLLARPNVRGRAQTLVVAAGLESPVINAETCMLLFFFTLIRLKLACYFVCDMIALMLARTKDLLPLDHATPKGQSW